MKNRACSLRKLDRPTPSHPRVLELRSLRVTRREGEKRAKDRATSIEKLFRPNEAIKSDRGGVITAYKDARKILPIPATMRGTSAKGGHTNRQEEEEERRKRERSRRERSEARFFLASLTRRSDRRDLIISPFLPYPKFDRSSADGIGFPVDPHEGIRPISLTGKRRDVLPRANNLANVIYFVPGETFPRGGAAER